MKASFSANKRAESQMKDKQRPQKLGTDALGLNDLHELILIPSLLREKESA